MISSLTGIPEIINPNTIIVNVSGVGYKVFVTNRLLEKLESKEVKLYIHTQVKEDALELYGFLNKDELLVFELLIDVSGIGPKTAILVLEKGEAQIKTAIMNADVDFFSSIPRIGRKNAQRIIIELKSKVGSLLELDLSGKENTERKELFEALRVMGFKKQEVSGVLRDLPENLISMEQKIKYALKKLGK